MTTFQTEGFTVTINTGYCPVESWQNLQKQLYDLLSTIREDNMPSRIDAIMLLLDALQPDWETARRMIPEKSSTAK